MVGMHPTTSFLKNADQKGACMDCRPSLRSMYVQKSALAVQ